METATPAPIDGLKLAIQRVEELHTAGQLATTEGRNLLIGIATAAHCLLAANQPEAKREGDEQ